MSEFRKIITKPGEVIGFETVFEENPYLRTGVPSKRGWVEKLEYTTDVYEDGVTYSKYCYVYLPHGYDKDDSSKKYNVLYYVHGNACDPTMFALGGNKPMIDMLFDSGEIKPCIIVFATYYFDPMKDIETRMTTGRVPSGDGNYPGIKANFYREVVENLIPAVELKYNTYLENASAEAVRASRDHRGFSGYSRGAVMTWHMFHYCLEYFRWFNPMSCMTHAEYGTREHIEPEVAINYVTAPIKEHPELPFFIYSTNGGKRDIPEVAFQMDYFTKLDCFSYGTDPGKNNIYFSVSDYYHADCLAPYYLWNSLKVLFKGV